MTAITSDREPARVMGGFAWFNRAPCDPEKSSLPSDLFSLLTGKAHSDAKCEYVAYRSHKEAVDDLKQAMCKLDAV